MTTGAPFRSEEPVSSRIADAPALLRGEVEIPDTAPEEWRP